MHTPHYLFDLNQTSNQIIKIGRTIYTKTVLSAYCDNIFLKQIKSTEEEEEENAIIRNSECERNSKKHAKEVKQNQLNISNQNQVIDLLRKFSDDRLRKKRKCLSQVSIQNKILTELTSNKEELITHSLPTTVLPSAMRNKYIYDLSKVYCKTFSNVQELQSRNMSYGKSESLSSFLKNEIKLPNKSHEESCDGIILNVTVNIPLSHLEISKNSQTLDCSAIVDHVPELQLHDKFSNRNKLRTNHPEKPDIRLNNYDENASKHKHVGGTGEEIKQFHPSDKKFPNKLPPSSKKVLKHPKASNKYDLFKSHTRQEKIMNIKKQVKRMLNNKSESFQHQTKLVNRDTCPNNNRKLKYDFHSIEDNIFKPYLECSEKRQGESNMLRTDNLKVEKLDQFLSFPREKEKETHIRKQSYSTTTEQKKHGVSATPNSSKKSKYFSNNKKIKNESAKFKHFYNESIKIPAYEKDISENDTEIEIQSRSQSEDSLQKILGKCKGTSMAKKERVIENEERQKDIKREEVKAAPKRNKSLDWRNQCTNMNDPDEEIFCSLSDLKKPVKNKIFSTGPNLRNLPKKKNTKKKNPVWTEIKREPENKTDQPEKHIENLKYSLVKSTQLIDEIGLQNNQQREENFQKPVTFSKQNKLETKMKQHVVENQCRTFYLTEKEDDSKETSQNNLKSIEGDQNSKYLSKKINLNTQNSCQKSEYLPIEDNVSCSKIYHQESNQVLPINNINRKKSKVQEKYIRKKVDFPKIECIMKQGKDKMVREISKEIIKKEKEQEENKKSRQMSNYDKNINPENIGNYHPYTSISRNNSLKVEKTQTICCPLKQSNAQHEMTREQLIAVKTAEFCKILLELVKLFSLSAMKDIERLNTEKCSEMNKRKNIK